MATRPDFQYSQLKQPHAFRLLRVLDEEFEYNPLRCVIEHYVLAEDRHPDYVALSYAWGDPKNVEEIIVNGTKLSITSNLASALRQLRKDGQPDETYLWADALCINQEDPREKTKQIQLMPKVYSGATKVITWLSREGRDAEHMAQLSAVLLKNPNRRRDQAAFLHALHALSSKDYWSRVWIVQELSLARSIEVVCQNQRIPWLKFVQVSCGHMSLPLSPGSAGSGSTSAILSNSRILELEAIRQDVQNEVPMPTLRALYRTRACQSTIKADRIFGLLGLTSDGHTKIGRLRYEDQITTTLLNFTMAEMDETGRLDMITFPDRRDAASYVHRTWVPNWINGALWRRLRVWQFRQVLESQIDLFRATKPAGRTKFDHKKFELKVWGHSLGTVCPDTNPTRLKYRNPSSLSAAADALITEFSDCPSGDSFTWNIKSSSLGSSMGSPSPMSSPRLGEASLNPSVPKMSVRATGSNLYRARMQSLLDLLEPLGLRRRVSSNDWQIFQDSADEDEEGPGMRSWIRRDPAKFRVTDEQYADELRTLLYMGSRYSQGTGGSSSSSSRSRPGSSGGMAAAAAVAAAAAATGGLGELCIGDVRFVGTTRGLLGLGHVAAKEGDHVFLIEGCSVPVLLRERKGVAGTFEVVGECLVLGLMKGEFFEKKKGRTMLGPSFKGSDKEMLILV